MSLSISVSGPLRQDGPPPLSTIRQKRLKATDADAKKKLVRGGRRARAREGWAGGLGRGLEVWARGWVEAGGGLEGWRAGLGLKEGPRTVECP